jgi:2-oxoglutarate/2-oxoacid ferredoxin oxidoreductase subunit alpha
MREAVRHARRGGQRVSALTVHSLWPLPERALAAAFASIERVVVAELNHGLYRREVEPVAARAGVAEIIGLERLDGEPIAPAQFLELLP